MRCSLDEGQNFGGNDTSFGFTVLARDPSGARRGKIVTDRGAVATPAFMPVGTQGTVKALSSLDLESIGAEIILANTYHLYLRPGERLIADMGGLHRFMSWQRPILTDSGGYQITSLSDLVRIGEEGVEFKSHLDGSTHFLSPEKIVSIQLAIGSDIMMVLDECRSWPCERRIASSAVERTTLWARRSVGAYGARIEREGRERVLFGIVQGSIYPDLRKRSVEDLRELDFPGYAIGGLSVGEPKEETFATLERTAPLLPEDRPRYLMGVGLPEDVIEAVGMGIDLFDCVLPTRNARNGSVFTSEGKLVVRNAAFAKDDRPLDPRCGCAVCKRYSRAYLRHLFNAGEMLGPTLATYHSVYFYLHMFSGLRQAIEEGRFSAWRKAFFETYRAESADTE